MIISRKEQNGLCGGAKGDDFVLVFIVVRVVIYEEDGVLEGEKMR
jgi:hypothetical protein